MAGVDADLAIDAPSVAELVTPPKRDGFGVFAPDAGAPNNPDPVPLAFGVLVAPKLNDVFVLDGCVLFPPPNRPLPPPEPKRPLPEGLDMLLTR